MTFRRFTGIFNHTHRKCAELLKQGSVKVKLLRRTGFRILGFFGAGFLLFLFVFFGPPKVYHKTSTPEFCASCHVMDYQYDAWMKNADHRNLECVECHLPNNNFANHMLWKGYDGTKDVIYFFGRLYADELRISVHGQHTVQDNCVRCHGEMVSQLNIEDRTCWSCHRRVNHKFPMAGIGQ